MKLQIKDFQEIVDRIRYKDWFIFVGLDGERCYIQVHFNAIDVDTGKTEKQQSRKWMLSPFMTTTEVVTTAYKAILAAEEHEARENFRYRGQRIYNPHFDVDELAQFSAGAPLDVRKAI
jgi:hypothetical protein